MISQCELYVLQIVNFYTVDIFYFILYICINLTLLFGLFGIDDIYNIKIKAAEGDVYVDLCNKHDLFSGFKR